MDMRDFTIQLLNTYIVDLCCQINLVENDLRWMTSCIFPLIMKLHLLNELSLSVILNLGVEGMTTFFCRCLSNFFLSNLWRKSLKINIIAYCSSEISRQNILIFIIPWRKLSKLVGAQNCGITSRCRTSDNRDFELF
jgi:hypothetical protein